MSQKTHDVKHYNLTYVGMSVSGRPIPAQPLQPNFETDEYARSYITLFSGGNGLFKDHGFDISKHDYGHATLYMHLILLLVEVTMIQYH
jgi:hypothetical protein